MPDLLQLVAEVVVVVGGAAGVVGGAVGLTRRRRRHHTERTERALALARQERRDHALALAALQGQQRAVARTARAEIDAALADERARLLAALLPVAKALDDVVATAPPSHPLRPGLILVARQLAGWAAGMSPTPTSTPSADDASDDPEALDPST